VAENFTVDVIDSSAFLNRLQGPASNVSRSRVNFKKNIDRSRTQKLEKRIQQEHGEAQLLALEKEQPEAQWFINEEERTFQGPDYTTKEEDTHKLLKYLRANLSKQDFCRYEVCPDGSLIKSIIISTTQMKEQYLTHHDVLLICPCTKRREQSRFGMLALVLYGVNSHGRNQVFAFCLVRESESEDRETFEFVLRQFLVYMDNRVPRHVLMQRCPQTSALFQGVKRVLTTKFSVKVPLTVDDPLVFCPYSLHEELKARFQFLQREERTLYQIVIALPFLVSESDLEAHLKDL